MKQLFMRKLLTEKREEPDTIDSVSGFLIWLDKDGEIHRDGDKPAVIRPNGDEFWYKHGKFHRNNNKPAIIYADGTKSWYKDGQAYKYKF